MIDIQKIVWKAARSENSRLLGCGVDDLERFAALYREALIAELVAGSGGPVLEAYVYQAPGGSLRSDFYTADQLAGAVLRERESCARECDSMLIMSCASESERGFNEGLRRGAAAIRSGE